MRGFNTTFDKPYEEVPNYAPLNVMPVEGGEGEKGEAGAGWGIDEFTKKLSK